MILFCCLLFLHQSYAQPAFPELSYHIDPGTDLKNNNSSTPFRIGKILVEGNQKTKSYVIERELPFKKGDSVYLPDLVKGFEVARQQLMNTRLFNEVVVALSAFRGYEVDIQIQVKERWYLFPLPYVKAVDRNISEWLKQGMGIDRINYGFKFNHNNFTGRNDKLRFWLISGYTKQLQFLYEQPYADKSLKHGFKVGLLYSFLKEVNYATINNQQAFIDSLSGGKKWYAHIDYTYRPGLRTFNTVRFAWVRQQVDSQILVLNPHFFNVSDNKISYPEFSYNLQYIHIDYIPYPLKGWMGETGILKKGIDKNMNMWQWMGKLTYAVPLPKKWYFQWQGQFMLRSPSRQPFINQQLFGYRDYYLRGLDKYVIDGLNSGLSRQTVRKELFSFNLHANKISKSHDNIPFRFYAKTFLDLGYASNRINPENSLTNKLLYTSGLGIDVVSLYDFVLRFDYCFNQLHQNGLFLHIKSDF